MVKTPGPAPDVMALMALGQVVADDSLATRFLALTGMDAATLRARAGDQQVLSALLDFLCAHEADLVRVAEAMDVRPEALAAAGRALGGAWE